MQQKPEHAQHVANPESLFKASKPLEHFDASARRQHAEAFKLLLYASGDGKIVEALWNSRDGVSPFMVGSRTSYALGFGATMSIAEEPVEMTHVLWSGDPFAPFHVPNVGERIFVDITEERAIEYATEFVRKCWDGGDKIPPLSGNFKLEADAVDCYAEQFFKPGAPDVVEVTAEMQAEFYQARHEHAAKLEAALCVQPPMDHFGSSAASPTRFA